MGYQVGTSAKGGPQFFKFCVLQLEFRNFAKTTPRQVIKDGHTETVKML
jgi:hypothetical protein